MRGGTSKGVFFKGELLPSRRDQMSRVILRVFGSGDQMQIDGLGGAYTETSKVMVVWKSRREGIDVDYLFGQVGTDEELVDYAGNCGNLTSAVGPFAIDEGLVDVNGDEARLRLYNVNTRKRVDAIFQLSDGKTEYRGDYSIDGVSRPGSRIDTIWYKPGGAVTGKLLPTGKLIETVSINDADIQVSLVDAGNPTVFVRATDVGMNGTEAPSDINMELLKQLERIRSKGAQMMGFVKRAEDATTKSRHMPYIAVVGDKRDYKTKEGEPIRKNEYDLLSRMFSMQKMHRAYAVTGAICTAVAAKIPGTIANEFYRGYGETVTIGHVKGVIDVGVQVDMRRGKPVVVSVKLGRTARRLMAGDAFYPDN
jgi:2-methylaconitate cis-trans-isomerase PrpF